MIIRCKFFFLWEDLVCRLVQFKTNRAFGGSEPTVVWIRLLLGVCVQFTNGTISYFVTFSLRCHWKFEQKRKKRHACSRSQLSWVIFFLIIHLYAFVVLWGGGNPYTHSRAILLSLVCCLTSLHVVCRIYNFSCWVAGVPFLFFVLAGGCNLCKADCRALFEAELDSSCTGHLFSGQKFLQRLLLDLPLSMLLHALILNSWLLRRCALESTMR